jgi:DNA primase
MQQVSSYEDSQMAIQKKVLGKLLREADDHLLDIIQYYMGNEALREVKRWLVTEYIGLCPFHKENTASFTVTEAKQFYHCFGCGSHGRAIPFIMEYTGLDFVRACAKAAEIIGFHLPSGRTNNVRARRRYRVDSKKSSKYKRRARVSYTGPEAEPTVEDLEDSYEELYAQQQEHQDDNEDYLPF